ncbi:hypothetical protein [Halalkalibacter sp. APA_J-10(15)]|uniref:hypothetical protein n=1 Tax=Halalkalibacter sp. APA_J-10(15) TaxID=2933805 RepID=UPI001FF4098D|nr:hypothetical protein [Halalkalibacter sp. APA_J-10(15)]MCK0471426.1 hypothetical protein [Halalkalibacter sp. APA_J-10(15)]
MEYRIEVPNVYEPTRDLTAYGKAYVRLCHPELEFVRMEGRVAICQSKGSEHVVRKSVKKEYREVNRLV